MAVPMSNAYYGNNFLPNQFQQPMQQQYQQPMQQQPVVQQTQQQSTPQIQNGGFVSVPSEDIARNYPVAPGNSITFKNENAPYVYTKTMGFSQLDRPIFEKFRLIKEENEVADVSMEPAQESNDSELMSAYVSTIETLKKELDDTHNEFSIFKESIKKEVEYAHDDAGIFKESIKKDIDNLWDEIESLKRQVKRQNRNRKKDNEEN